MAIAKKTTIRWGKKHASAVMQTPDTRTRILQTTLTLMRAKGYEATTVDDLCTAAGVTKGAFFHYFDSKEHLAREAADFFAAFAAGIFSNAPHTKLADPLDRFLGYIDFRREILQGPIEGFTCLLGTFVQETYHSHPALRALCHEHIWGHASTLVEDIRAAKEKYAPASDLDPEGLALHTQAVLQGAFILAKAQGSREPVVESLQHLRRYVELLFHVSATTSKEPRYVTGQDSGSVAS